MSASGFVSATCQGERCFCGAPASHKVEEAIAYDDPNPNRHPLTSYVCRSHFRAIMGPIVDRIYGSDDGPLIEGEATET